MFQIDIIPQVLAQHGKLHAVLIGCRNQVLLQVGTDVGQLIDELQDAGFGSCRAAFCRELTKKYEQVLRLTVDEAKEYFEETHPKGEFVVCLEPLPDTPAISNKNEVDLEDLIRRFEDEGLSTKEMASRIAEITGGNKKDVYNQIVKCRRDVTETT